MILGAFDCGLSLFLLKGRDAAYRAQQWFKYPSAVRSDSDELHGNMKHGIHEYGARQTFLGVGWLEDMLPWIKRKPSRCQR